MVDSYFSSLVDDYLNCLSNCNGLYGPGLARDRCYEICIRKFERLGELAVSDGGISTYEADAFRGFINYCRSSLGKVEDLRKYCIERYEELSRAPQQSSKDMEMPSAQSSIAEGQLPSRLVDCYQYCVKYHGDNPTALQDCRLMCDAMWKPSIQRVDIERFRNCFPSGLLELSEFETKYKSIGKFGFDDWQIVAHISGVISKMIEEGKRGKCPDLDEAITKVITSKLDEIGINRYSIRNAYLHGMNDEVRRLVERVFPNVTEIRRPTTPITLKETPQPSLTPPPSMPQSPTPRRRYSFKGGRRRVGGAIAAILFILSLLMWGYAVYVQMVLPMTMAFILALIALVLRHKWYTGLWFFIVLISTLIMLGAGLPRPSIIQPTTQSVIIDSNWVSQFISIVNEYRAEEGAQPLQYCPWLSEFAQVRFNTMIQNPAISHYGYDQDFEEYLGQYQSFLIPGEEAFGLSSYSPSQFVQDLINNAPLHWRGLMNPNYTYYGYYIGNGPDYVVIGSCPVTEIPGPNINIPQYYQSYGCQYELENTTWLVIELSNWCSGPVTLPFTYFTAYLISPQYYMYLPIQYGNLPTTQSFVTLNINITSTSPVRLFIFTPSQFNEFGNLNMQQAWQFTGPAYYYGGESTTFDTSINLETTQLTSGGYYLVISDVLPNAQPAVINGEVSITFIPSPPNIPTTATSINLTGTTIPTIQPLPNITIPTITPPNITIPTINITIPTINITIPNTSQQG